MIYQSIVQQAKKIINIVITISKFFITIFAILLQFHSLPFFSQQINSQQHTPHHQLHHHGHGLGFRNSFTSMAVSLPPDLDHHYSQQHLIVNHTPNNGTSTENLQCQWHCNELPKFDIRPQVIILIIY